MTANIPWYYIVGPLGAVVTGGAGTLWYRLNKRTDLDAKKESAAIDEPLKAEAKADAAQSQLVTELRAERDKREAELAELRADDKAERKVYIETLGAIKSSMEQMASSLNTLTERVARIETNLAIVKDRS